MTHVQAVYTRKEANAEAEWRAVASLCPRADEADVRVFDVGNRPPVFPYAPGAVGHVLYPCPAGSFDRVAVSPDVCPLHNTWSAALLTQCRRSLKPGGELIMGYYPRAAAEHKGYWSLKALEAHFGKADRVDERQRRAVFVKDGEITSPPSVLGWFFREYARALQVEFEIADWLSAGGDVFSHFGAMCRPRKAPLCDVPAGAGELAGGLTAKALQRQFKKLSYYLYGLGAKSALMAHIALHYGDRRKALRMVDHGGGPGFLAMELLLDPECPVTEALNCDPLVYNLFLSRLAFSYFMSDIGQQYSMHPGYSQEFVYEQPVDIVSFIGSLLYVPKEDLGKTLDAVWEHLAPGGVLVVQENIKAESYRKKEEVGSRKGVQDYGLMFTVPELDALLGRYGKIERFLASATAPVNKLLAVSRTVYRVVRKK